MANRVRNHILNIYISEEENLLMKRKMELAGIKTISMYIRGLIRYGMVYEVDYSVIREMNAQLGKIGSNVNQIAKRINETHHIYKDDLEEIKKRQSEIWRIQKYILSQQPSIRR